LNLVKGGIIMKKVTMYVIAAQPERTGSLYYNENGEKAEKQFAKDFYGFEDAKEFAKEKNIELNEISYITVK
jgi:hypothetical protein